MLGDEGSGLDCSACTNTQTPHLKKRHTTSRIDALVMRLQALSVP